MASKAVPDKFRSTVKGNRGRTEAVEAKNMFASSVSDSEKRFSPTLNVALPSMTAQESIQDSIAAVESIPIMGPGNRLFMPVRNGHGRSGKA
jgi:hypothetical protein